MCLTNPDVGRDGIGFVNASFGDTFSVTDNFLCMFESVLFRFSGGVFLQWLRMVVGHQCAQLMTDRSSLAVLSKYFLYDYGTSVEFNIY